MLAVVPSINGLFAACQEETILKAGSGNVKNGFILGCYDSTTWDEDLLVIREGFLRGDDKGLFYVIPFRVGVLRTYEQVKLAEFDRCVFINNYFVVGRCKIYMPESEVLMHIESQYDQKNLTEWVIEGIVGDKVWSSNVDVRLYDESNERVFGDWSWGSVYGKYYDIGDRVSVCTGRDGYFYFKLIERVSGDLLYRSPLVKY
jgi:hypothetical protein